jgi:cytoskeletal protein RodZ
VDSGASIGQTIVAARLRAGLSIDELSEKTRIRPALLAGMEADDFQACGGDTYARGHLRSVATALGLDGNALLDQFSRQMGSPLRSSPSVAPIEQPTRIMDRADRSDGLRQLAGSLGIQDSHRGRIWLPVMALLAVIVIGGGMFTFLTHRGSTAALPDVIPSQSQSGTATPRPSSTSNPDPSPSSSPSITPSTSPTQSPSANPTPTSTESPTAAPASGTTVQITVTGQASWVSAATSKGGDSIYQGLLSSGESKTFTSDTNIYLVIGDAGAVTLSVNGYDLGTPGSPGQVIRHLYLPGNPTA